MIRLSIVLLKLAFIIYTCHAGKYAICTTQSDGQLTTEDTSSAVCIAKASEKPKASKRREWYLISEPWCQHCPAAKRVFLAKGWPKENILTNAECKRRFGFVVPFVPYEFGAPIKPAQ